ILMFIFILAASFGWQFLLEIFNIHKLYWWLDAGSLFKGSLLYAPVTHVFLFIYFVYHSVAKFLYYIDTRSLREGWDVELALVRGVRETEEAA
ncbi:MAG: hypothetical protein KDK34_12540, partial [Leptospiraceae bacterium]|nr:hypothetical protein [Leptospiraceae bacterium]